MRGNIFSCTRGYLKVGNGSPPTVIQEEEGVWGLPPAWAGTRDRIIYSVTVTALHPFNTTPPPLPQPLLGWSAAGSVAPGHVTPCRWSPGRCPETSHRLLRTTRQSQVNRRHHGRRSWPLPCLQRANQQRKYKPIRFTGSPQPNLGSGKGSWPFQKLWACPAGLCIAGKRVWKARVEKKPTNFQSVLTSPWRRKLHLQFLLRSLRERLLNNQSDFTKLQNFDKGHNLYFHGLEQLCLMLVQPSGFTFLLSWRQTWDKCWSRLTCGAEDSLWIPHLLVHPSHPEPETHEP